MTSGPPAEWILDFHPDIDGFVFGNAWKWTPSDLDFLERRAGPYIDTAYLAANMVGLDAAVGILTGLPGIGLLVGAIAGSVAVASGAPRRLLRQIAGEQQTFGMCGGMVQAVADYWMARWLIPGGNAAPDDSSPTGQALRAYIRERLADTLQARLVEFLTYWGKVSDPNDHPNARLGRELAREYDMIRQLIYSGVPVTIGVVGNTTEPWNTHQVLCYGYRDTAQYQGELYIYDPNAPGAGKTIKLDWSPSLEDNRCSIWTDMTTGKVGDRQDANGNLVKDADGNPIPIYCISKKENHLGFLFVVPYTPRTPDPSLTAGPLRIESADQVPRFRFDIPMKVSADITYHADGEARAFWPYLSCQADRQPDMGNAGQPFQGATRTQTAVWKGVLPGSTGARTLTLRACLPRPNHPVRPGAYTCFKLVPDAGTGGDATASLYLHGVPMTSRVTWSFAGAVPQPGAGSLRYPFTLEVDDTLAPDARYDWALTGTHASGSVSGAGRRIGSEAQVNPADPRPSDVTIGVHGIDTSGRESNGSVTIPLPRAAIDLEASLDRSTRWGEPRMRVWHNHALMATKATLLQAYSHVAVVLKWRYFAGPVTVTWAFSDCPFVFGPAQPPAGDALEIPVSLVGNNDPRQYYMLGAHEPRDVVLRCTVSDAPGQSVTIDRLIPAWYPAAQYVTTPAIVDGAERVAEGLAAVLPEVRQRLTELAESRGTVPDLPDLPIGAGRLGDLLREHSATPEEIPGAGAMGLDQMVLTFGKTERFPLEAEAPVLAEATLASGLGVTSGIAVAVGEIRLTPQFELGASEAVSPAMERSDRLMPGEWEPVG